MFITDGTYPLPDALTTIVREVPVPATFMLNQILPDRYFDRNDVVFTELTKTNRTARFRAFDSKFHVSERDVVSDKQVRLPAVSSSKNVGELERLNLEFARLAGTNRAALIDQVYDDATSLTHEVQARMELARGQVLSTGTFALTNEGGITTTADFAVPGGNLVTPAGALWSNVASATPITDILAWADAYVALNGFAPGSMILTRAQLHLLQRNAEVRQYYASLVGSVDVVTSERLSTLLTSLGLPDVQMVYDTQVDVDGTTTRVIPTNKVVFLPPNVQDVGFTAWGVSATALELVRSSEVDMSFEQAPGIVAVVEKEGPPYREFTYVDAVGMPIIQQPRYLMIGTVL
jgi:hypothetical protein